MHQLQLNSAVGTDKLM